MFDHLKNKFPIDSHKWESYIKSFHKLEVPAKTVLLNEGKVSDRMFFIEKGCIRCWFNKDGKDLTLQFFFEGGMVGSIESFRKRIPSPITIETIEPSVLWYADKKDIDSILNELIEIPEIREKFIDSIFERTFDYIKHFVSFIKDSPEQRYQNILKENPQIIKRIPQHYIASYLGISSVHLSRIKNKLLK
ncbi:Crp/Fnr family transcriptional regulator [Flavobacterium sp. 5]|uniref:Crp/Fnr family transcriptional regulator n=1 Tax=Flavobacterium sp. 5 TaxID=2035199 RepID=UPI000C2CE2A8|nr:Crp/Fnr family transcriptional regulator [Flavobacterium sp. 5]PKB17806.1 CRP-like cAMP-binding protein [Flavobacterium sp. 5]